LVRHLVVNQTMRRFESCRLSHSGSRLVGKPPALGAGESEFDSRDPDSRWGLDVVGGMRVLQTRWMGSSPIVSTTLAAVAEWIRREFPKLVDAGSIPAGSTGRIAETD
jgi:hypothetical protein